jgi:curved DNA-binding protein CbpA
MSRSEAAALLGVGVDASQAEVETAYKRLMLRTHPDLGGTTGLATQINAARAAMQGR